MCKIHRYVIGQLFTYVYTYVIPSRSRFRAFPPTAKSPSRLSFSPEKGTFMHFSDFFDHKLVFPILEFHINRII